MLRSLKGTLIIFFCSSIDHYQVSITLLSDLGCELELETVVGLRVGAKEESWVGRSGVGDIGGEGRENESPIPAFNFILFNISCF